MKPVTDPDVLEQLNGKRVTDPALLAELNGTKAAEPKRDFVTEAGLGLYNLFRTRQNEAKDTVLGGVRGFGSIGATLLTPLDAAARSVGVENDWVGRDDRRQMMDEGLRTAGADPSSSAFGAGKLAAEIYGISRLPGGAAKLLGRIPGVAKAVPGFIESLASSGINGPNLFARTAGGAASGGLTAGMIDPSQAKTGALIGGAIPGVTQAAGTVGNAVGSLFRGPQVNPSVISAAGEAGRAGYVIPPTQVKPSLINRLLEGFSGKITTAQNASARNQQVTNRLVNEALDLPADTQLSHEVLNKVRGVAGRAYETVRGAGVVASGKKYSDALDDIVKPYVTSSKGFPNAKPHPVIQEIDGLRSTAFDADSAVSKIIELREAASAKYASGDKAFGKALKRAADAIEQALDDHLVAIGAPADTLKNFRDARTLIAKTYSAEKALNPASGSIDATKLATQVRQGKPLSGGLKTAGDFALQFPKAAQAVEKMGSLPQLSPLDYAVGAVGAGQWALGDQQGFPWPAALMFARPAARAAALSGPVQRGLTRQTAPMGLLGMNEIEQLIARSLPAIVADQ